MRNPDTDGGAALVTWDHLQRLGGQRAGSIEVLFMAEGDPLALAQVTPTSTVRRDSRPQLDYADGLVLRLRPRGDRF